MLVHMPSSVHRVWLAVTRRLKHLLHGFRVVRDCGCALLRVHSSNQANAYAFPLTSARTMMCQTHATDYSPRPPVSVAYCTLMTMKAITSPTRPNRNVWKNTILPRPMHLPVHGQWWSRPTIHTPHSRQCTLSIGWCTLQYRQNFLVRRRKEPDAAAGTEASGENVITSSSSAAAGGVVCGQMPGSLKAVTENDPTVTMNKQVKSIHSQASRVGATNTKKNMLGAQMRLYVQNSMGQWGPTTMQLLPCSEYMLPTRVTEAICAGARRGVPTPVAAGNVASPRAIVKLRCSSSHGEVGTRAEAGGA